MDKAKIAESLRTLAGLVEHGGVVSSADVETERVGHMVKTSVVLWSVAPDAVPVQQEVRWCSHLLMSFRGPDRVCGAMLDVNGGCPRQEQHSNVTMFSRRW